MPIVPTYDPGQVAPSQGVGARVSDVTPAAFGGGIVSGMDRLDGAVGGAASNAGQLQEQLEQQHDEAVAKAYALKASTFTNQTLYGGDGSPGYLSLQNADALNAQDGATKSITDYNNDLLSQTGNDRQRALLAQNLGQQQNDAFKTIQTHALAQAQSWYGQQSAATVLQDRSNYVNAAVAAATATDAGTSDNLQQTATVSYAKMAAEVARNLRQTGLYTDAVYSQELQKHATLADGAILDSLLNNSTASGVVAAQRYFVAHGSDMDPASRVQYEQKVNQAVQANGGAAAVDAANGGVLPGGATSAPAATNAAALVAAAGGSTGEQHELSTIAHLENPSGDPTLKNPLPGVTSRGLWQFNDATWAAMGGTAANRDDPAVQAQMALKLYRQNKSDLASALGRAPTLMELYLAHQQGLGGAKALLTAPPETGAVAAMEGAGISNARAAIINNLPASLKPLGDKVTVGQFLQAWGNNVAAGAQARATTPGVSPTLNPSTGAPLAMPPDKDTLIRGAMQFLPPGASAEAAQAFYSAAAARAQQITAAAQNSRHGEPHEKLLSSILHEVQHAIQAIEGHAQGAPSGAEGLRRLGYADALREEIERLEKADFDGDRYMLERTAADRVYRRSAGEIEARNTQARQAMTPQERADLPPDYTRDTPRADAIVRLHSGADVMETAIERSASDSALDIARMAKESTSENQRADLGAVSKEVVDGLKDVGVNLRDDRVFQHTFDTRDARHLWKMHGSAKEVARGQVPLTEADFAAIPEVLHDPDVIGLGGKSRQKHPAVVYVKAMPDGTALLVEEVHNGKGEFAVKSMWKVPGAADAARLRALADINVHNDAGSPTKIIDRTGETKARSFDQSARGDISFPPGRAVIRLFKGSDASTPIHELGHYFLEKLQRAAEAADASDEVKQLWQTAKDYLGHEGGELTTDQHENFARSFEAYAMEGKAPAEGLRTVFRKFAQWLTRIYRTVRALDVNLSPQIRDVFDRLLASQDEIRAMREKQGLNPIFASAKDAGMTKAEFAAYTKALTDANGAAEDRLLRALTAKIRRERTKEWQDQKAAMRPAVQAEVDARPDVKAYHFLTRGELLGADEQPGRVPVNKDAVSDIYGTETALDRLPRSVPPVYSAEGGVHPDAIADLTGHRTGEDMLNGVMDLEQVRRDMRERGDNRSVRRALVEDEVERRMIAEHGDVLHDGSIEEEALDALHDDARMQQVAMEVRALGRKAEDGQPQWSGVAMKAWADGSIASKRIGDIRPDTYLRAERQAGKEAQRALLAGNTVKALERKRAQLLNMHLFTAARQARKLADAQINRLTRIGARNALQSTDQSYLNQAHGLIARFGFKTPANVQDRPHLTDWLDERAKAYETIVAAPWLRDEGVTRARNDLTPQDLADVHDAARSILSAGRAAKSVQIEGKRVELADLVSKVRENTQVVADIPRSNAAVPTKSMAREGLYRLVNPRDIALASQFLRAARINSMTAQTGFSMVVGAEHASAYAQTIGKIGAVNTGKGVARFMSNPLLMSRYVFDRSPEMAASIDAQNRDLRDQLDDLNAQSEGPSRLAMKLGAPQGVAQGIADAGRVAVAPLQFAQRASHAFISLLSQYTVRVPTWLGAESKAISEGMSETDAAAYADKVVRTTHGTGFEKDLAKIQSPGSSTGAEAFKLFTMYQGYHNTQLNQLMEAGYKASRGDKLHGLHQAFWVGLAAPIIGGLVTGKGPNDIANAADWAGFAVDHVLRGAWAPIPIVRDLGNLGLNVLEGKNPEYEATPAVRGAEVSARALADVKRMTEHAFGVNTDKDVSKKATRDLIEAPGYWLGLPTGQLARTVQYEHDVQTGDQQPATPVEHARGLAFGAPPKEPTLAN